MENKPRTISLRIVAGIIIAATIIIAVFASGIQLPTSQIDVGRLTIFLKDAPVDVDELWITITGLEVHKTGDNAGWTNIDFLQGQKNVTFNLLEYQEEEVLSLADVEVDPGNYTKIRMSVVKAEAWYYTESPETDTETEQQTIEKTTLKVPSGKIDVITEFTITGGENVVVLIDMQPDWVSISHSGNLRPILKASISQGGA